jgi:hydrogenase maturation protease
MSAAQQKILLLGLGNDILTDDAVGLQIVRRLRIDLAGEPLIEFQETTEMGLALLDFIVGYREVLIVDAIQTGRVPPGTLHEVDAAGLTHLAGRTPHFLGVGETLALGRQLGLTMPARVRIFAVEVQDPFTLSTELTAGLQQALPSLLVRVREALLQTAASPPAPSSGPS